MALLRAACRPTRRRGRRARRRCGTRWPTRAARSRPRPDTSRRGRRRPARTWRPAARARDRDPRPDTARHPVRTRRPAVREHRAMARHPASRGRISAPDRAPTTAARPHRRGTARVAGNGQRANRHRSGGRPGRPGCWARGSSSSSPRPCSSARGSSGPVRGLAPVTARVPVHAPGQSAASAAATTASVYGITTTSAGCPAAAVRGAVARCPVAAGVLQRAGRDLRIGHRRAAAL